MAGTLSTQRRKSLTPGVSAKGVEGPLMSWVKSQHAGYPARHSANAKMDDAADSVQSEPTGQTEQTEQTGQTRGEMEATVCEFISRFALEYLGCGPKSIRAHLIGELIVVRLQGVLTAAEHKLVNSHSGEKGRDLLKQVRTHLIETARPIMESMVHMVTGCKLLSLHHDISTVTGEEVMLFTLAEAPDCRQPKKRQRSDSRWDS